MGRAGSIHFETLCSQCCRSTPSRRRSWTSSSSEGRLPNLADVRRRGRSDRAPRGASRRRLRHAVHGPSAGGARPLLPAAVVGRGAGDAAVGRAAGGRDGAPFGVPPPRGSRLAGAGARPLGVRPARCRRWRAGERPADALADPARRNGRGPGPRCASSRQVEPLGSTRSSASPARRSCSESGAAFSTPRAGWPRAPSVCSGSARSTWCGSRSPPATRPATCSSIRRSRAAAQRTPKRESFAARSATSTRAPTRRSGAFSSDFPRAPTSWSSRPRAWRRTARASISSAG